MEEEEEKKRRKGFFLCRVLQLEKDVFVFLVPQTSQRACSESPVFV